MMQAVGAYALPFKQSDVGPDYATNLGAGYCNLRKLSIFGGSNEIQKNIISQMIMGL
jgi:alkylation response protein AidB-like acyl-CoA dehydrogenase